MPNHLAGLPELRLGGLDEESARALLATVISGPLDPGTREATLPYVSRLLAAWRGDAPGAAGLEQALGRRGVRS